MTAAAETRVTVSGSRRLSLCPHCGQWREREDPTAHVLMHCRGCWLGPDEAVFKHGVEQFRVWYKGTFGEAAYREMRNKAEAGK